MEKNQIATLEQSKKSKALISTNFNRSKGLIIDLHLHSKKVRDFDSEDFKGLYNFILNLCKLIGVTEPPQKEIIILLINHIKIHHSDFSKEEIENAFSLATAGKLDFEFNHYNRLTPQLMSKTLNHYSNERRFSISEFRELEYKEKLRLEELKNKKSDKEISEMRFNNALSLFDEYKQNGSVDDLGNATYQYFRSLKLLKTNREQANEYFQRAYSIIKNESESNRLKDIMSGKSIYMGKEQDSELDNKVVIKARKLALNDFFQSVIDSEINLKDLIESKLI
jgi:hypothetical protein